jgi:hypothetical protein
VKPAAGWLIENLPRTPPHLLDEMLAAVGDGEQIPEVLASAAMALYRGVMGGTGDRRDALPLLVADALFTHAFHAQADLQPDGLMEFSQRWSRMDQVVEGLGQ